MIYHITYLSDGLKVKGYLGLPSGFHLPASKLQTMLEQFYHSSELPITKLTSGIKRHSVDIHSCQLPALIYCRGGIGKVGKVKTEWIEQFANFGYIIFAPSYRGNEDGEGRDEFGGQEQEDVHAAYKLLHSFPFVNANQISIMGFSRGAINAAQAAAAIPQLHSLILWGGVSSLTQTYEERIDLRRMLKRVLGGSPSKIPDAYEARSPLSMAAHIHCPILIMHGTQDIQVDFSHGLNIYTKLTSLGANVELHDYEGYGHHFPASVHKMAVARMFQWINKIGS